MNTLRLPISFNFDGSMQSIVDGSDEYYATILGNSIQIQKGELALSRLYGIDDPVFSGKSLQRLMSEVAHISPKFRFLKLLFLEHQKTEMLMYPFVSLGAHDLCLTQTLTITLISQFTT